MPNTNGHGKNICATFYILLVIGLLYSCFATTVQAQNFWTRIKSPVYTPWAPDQTWGPGSGRGGSRFVSTYYGDIYLTVGNWLYKADKEGVNWNAIAYQYREYAEYESHQFSLAVSADGKQILWGNLVSQDGGKTWAKLIGPYGEVSPYSRYSFEYTWDGTFLMGGSIDDIFLRKDLGQSLVKVHHGNTYGSIVDFQSTRGILYAAPGYDSLLFSNDGGLSWKQVGNEKITGIVTNYLALEQKAYQHFLWAVEQPRNPSAGKPQLIEIENQCSDCGPYSITRHAGKGGPDSSVTALGVLGSLESERAPIWLGSWGQGVFVSQDLGETFTRVNEGLTDLHIEALHVLENGSVLALTRHGMFRWTGCLKPSTSISGKQKNQPVGAMQNRMRMNRGEILVNGRTPFQKKLRK